MNFDAIEPGVWPDLIYPPYKSTVKRGPTLPPLRIKAQAPTHENLLVSPSLILPHDTDLTAQGDGQPLGEKIVVTGLVLDEDGIHQFTTFDHDGGKHARNGAARQNGLHHRTT